MAGIGLFQHLRTGDWRRGFVLGVPACGTAVVDAGDDIGTSLVEIVQFWYPLPISYYLSAGILDYASKKGDHKS